MPLLSLRSVIGFLAAGSVAVIATVTLTIALTTALSALRSVGTTHAAALIANADMHTAALFGSATDSLVELQRIVASKAWPYPSDDDTTLTVIENYMFTSCATNLATWSSFTTYVADNTYVTVAPLAAAPRDVIQFQTFEWSPYTTTWPNQTLKTAAVQGVYLANFSTLTPQDPLYSSIFGQPLSKPAQSDLWTTQLVPATINGQKNLFAGFQAFTDATNHTGTYAIAVAPLYRRGDSRVAKNLFAISLIAIEFGSISDFLATLGGTPHTVAFAYDGSGYLIGSSINSAAPYLTISVHGSGDAVPDGCLVTVSGIGSVGPAKLVCRASISAYPFAPLQQLASNQPNALLLGTTTTASSTAVWTTLGSDNYFVAAANVDLAFPGMQLNVALIMPEDDIIGDVVTGRNISIGITAALFVVMAAINVVVVSLLLRPLTRVAERMVDAANLEDDDTPDEPSAMAEVRALQDAYFEMNAELNRIRSFVPQTVLAARRAGRGGGSPVDRDLELSTVEDVNDTNTHSNQSDSQKSRRSSLQLNSSLVKSPKAAAIAMGDVQLRQTVVTVLSGNLSGFHRAIAGATVPADISNGIAAVVAAVSDAVATRKGAFTFHGDRFLCTFNAAQQCGSHARRACEAALALADTVPTLGMRLPMRLGVATGTCLVGNVGSDRVKTFSTMGAAFTIATTLEHVGKKFACNVTLSHRTILDVALHYDFRYLDFVELPTRDGGMKRSLVGTLVPKAVDATGGPHQPSQEWLYVVGAERQSAWADRNRIFEMIAQGDASLAAARSAFEKLSASVTELSDGLEQLLVK